MIEDEMLARGVSELMLGIGAKLDASVAGLQPLLPQDDFIRYRRAIGGIMGAMLLDVLNPIYERHPQLKPMQLD